jgi:preprotein translocase subunit SecA
MLISYGHSKLGQKTPAQVKKSLSRSPLPRPETVDSLGESVKVSALNATSSPTATPAKVKVQFESPDLGTRLLNWVTSLGKGPFQAELAQINKAEKLAKDLLTPQDFQAQTAHFQARLAQGESLESLRVEAYAVARQAAKVAKGMRPYDCQVAGALAMADGKIAEMMTGEGKTLTAVLPLYLHALAGKGAHLVTVNDRLAQRDRDDMAPIFETLGLSVGCALETMSPEEKRKGYNCDVTYTTDRALGFDFLRDRTVRSPEERLQREPFFALVDEVDQVLLDEARTPLIISGRGEAPTTDYQVFQEIVEDLRPGIEYYVDRENGAAWLTETGTDFVQNELHKETIPKNDAQALAGYHRKRGAIRAEGNAWQALQEHRKAKPGFLTRIRDKSWNQQKELLEKGLQKAEARSEAMGDSYNLFNEDHMHRTRALYASLRANALFEQGVDYLVQDHRVKIVDENKGRTSKGRRYNEGLHQALEAKSGVPIRPESKPVASITYPNLFAKYEKLSGMSGTAKSSEGEFEELYNLSVVEVPTNLQFQLDPKDPASARRHNRIDQTDVVFAGKKEKFEAVVQEAIKAYEDGVPVLVGTLSVESNEYVYARLIEEGVAKGAVQLLNAEHVRGDKTLENQILANAGRSGLITVATNMAGRGVNVKPDLVNYKSMAIKIEEVVGQKNGSVTVDVANQKEAERLAEWLEGNYPYRIGEGAPEIGETLIRVNSEKPAVGTQLKSQDFPTGGLYVIGSERAKSRRIDDQLIGRAARQGAPGKSQFFLSLEDDLFQYFGGAHLDAAMKLLGSKEGRLESEMVEGLVGKVQARVGAADFAAREDTTAYDKVMNKQRDTYYAIRDSVLDSKADLRSKLVEDAQNVVTQHLASTLTGRKHQPADIRKALAELNDMLHLSLTWNGSETVKGTNWHQTIEGQVQQQLNRAFVVFDQAGAAFDEPYRQTLLNNFDEAWSFHLESMQSLKTGVQWMTFAEKDPETEFSLQGFEVFEHTLDAIQKNSVQQTIPQLMLGVKMLRVPAHP